ncbi:Spy0128 family protein [Streptococcus sp. HF-2466]|uniref:Spy0128 family protein n=2 Tax=Streptococcus sp. HF-2466 TaxID=2785792 RepID=UPI00189E5C99|nr:FctA domain-containing protein [Streptococcus sp. HF-2466]MBF7051414.1 LPXTG cell wall anchor domain-containing protein [Streptococcus sp. HF-2466]
MIKKAMNLVGVALLLASTILSPASAVAQTLSNQSSTVTTQSSPKTGTTEQPTSPTESTQKTADTSSSQGQQPATENKAEANSNEQENKPSTSKEESSDASQVKEDTSSQKASKVEEKSETQPGAPPAAKDTKDTQAAPKTKRAAKEIDAITQFSITDTNGKPLDKPLQQWEQFKIDGQFKLPNNDVHEGDYTTFKISENLVLVPIPDFDIKDPNGQVVARANVDTTNRTLKLIYTKYVENKSDITGSFYFYTYVNHHIVKEKKKVPIEITVNRNVVKVGEPEFGGLTPPTQKDLAKVGNFKPDNTITYDITVNQSGKEVLDAKVTDILKTPNVSYDKNSFEIYKGKWVIEDNRWVLKDKENVTSQFKVEFPSESEFFIKLGKINKGEGYHIKYKAKPNYKLQSGEVVENIASLWSSETKIIDSIAKTTYLEAGGSAEGYVYSITLHKKDETSGSSLAGAVFRVTRDRNGAVVGNFTTDSTGKVTIPNLLKDNYTIKEIKAPDGYQLTGKEIKVKPENFNSSKSYSLDISNKRQKVSATLQVNKKLVGRKLKAQEFEFDLVDNTEVSPTVGKILQTVKNNANGEVNFKSLEYTKAGTYEYFIRENKGSAPGVTYDQKFITVTVEVKEKSGKLEVSKVTYMTDGEEIKKPTFNNRYTPVKTSAKLEVKKVLTGRPLQEGEFEFELKDLQQNKKILETVKNTADGKVQFKELKYTKAGTYHYTISEKAGDVPGVEYEPNLISATVTVEDKGGKLEVTKVTYSKAGEETKHPTFENRYTPGKTFARLEVNKVLTGRQLQKDEFEFELTGKEDHIHQTKKNTATGKIQFDTIEYDKAGEYHYTIKEKNNGLGGITYDPKEVKATVKITDDGKGKLHSEIVYEKNDTTFNNTYTTQATSATFDVTKELTGRKLKAQEFEFELKEDGKPDVLQTAKNDAKGKVQFQAINYDKAGEYHYTITEKNNGLTGVTYDSSEVKVTVKVTDDGKGKLSTTVTYDGGKKTFKNTFTPKEITVPLQVTKTLTGRNLQDDEFEFELYDGKDNSLLQTAKNKADGTIPFTALKFTKTGLYNYLIKEKAGKVLGVDYDKQPIKVTIRVQQEEDGQLIYNIVYLGFDESGKNKISKQSFTNKYTAKGTDATFSVTKKLTGRALKDGEFSFELKEDGKADVLQTKKNDKAGKVQFDAIKYQTVGTHKYTITEKNTGLGGVTYDTKTIKVTVEVTDNGKGQLVSKVTYENNDQTFNNTYSSQKVSAQLSVTKELTGRALNDQEFEFELVGSDDNIRQTKKNAADGRVTFDAIDYTKVGTYHYTIKEKDNGLGGVTYDKKEIKATVKVTDDGNGQLVAQVSYDTANPIFRNTYLAKETTATLEANKVLTGRDLEANEFAFDLIDPNGKVVETVKNAKDGKISFKELTFKTAGTYTYTIKEQAGALGGVKYDTKVIKATVTVTDDGKGQLHATVAYENNQNTFTNTYSADKATATLSAKKLLEGRNLKEGEFEFELTGTDDQVRQTKTNAQDGSVTFDTIEYTKAGTYHYTITEKDTKLGGVKYDTKVIKATVTVTDDGQGRLVTKVAYEKDDQTFKNTYSAAKTNAQLSVKKALTGRALKDGEFEFELKGQDDKVTQSKKNAQDGSVTFDTIEYTKAGTYHYTITEKNTRLGGVTYDKKVIKATVTVTDNGQGQLVAQVAYEQNDQTFTNQYQAASTTAQLSANKQLTGRDLKAGEFSFELKNDKDEVLETATNDKDGKITFKTLTYTAVGTYQYTIIEKDTKLGGVKYDTKVIKATVTVTDDGQGRLVTKVAYEKDDQTFKNTYSVAKTNAQLSVKKALTGRALKDGEFEFELKGQDDKVTQSKKNAQDGSVTFDTIEYTKAGTYHYTITEKDTKLQGITYDKKVIKVTVTVTDDGNGQLHAKVSYDKNIKTFENRYTPPKKGLPKTGTVIHMLAIFIGLIVLAGAVYLIKKKS